MPKHAEAMAGCQGRNPSLQDGLKEQPILDIIKDQNILQRIDKTEVRNDDLFLEVHTRMTEEGYHSVEQGEFLL